MKKIILNGTPEEIAQYEAISRKLEKEESTSQQLAFQPEDFFSVLTEGTEAVLRFFNVKDGQATLEEIKTGTGYSSDELKGIFSGLTRRIKRIDRKGKFFDKDYINEDGEYVYVVHPTVMVEIRKYFSEKDTS